MPTPIVIMPSPTRASPATPVNGPATATKASQPADTGASNSSDGPNLQIGSGDTWGDIYNSLSDEEQSCIRNELGEEQLAELLDTPSFFDGSMTAYSRKVLPCITEDAARELLLATLEAAGDEFSEEEEGCLRELLGNFNPVDLANASVPEPTQEQELMMISFLLGVVGCLPELAGEFAGEPTNGNSLGGKPIVQDPALLWSFTAGGWVLIAPAVVDGVVYAGSDDHSLYALIAETGELLWSYATGDVIRSTPTVVDGRVFFGSNDNHVYALDAATGQELWKHDTGDWVQYTPAVSAGKVYVAASSGGDRKVHALDAATGEVVWVADHPFPTGAEQTPTPMGDKVYAPGAEYGQFFALDAATGEVVWQAEVGGYVQSAPAMLDGVVYLTVANQAYAMDAATGEIMWHVNTDQFPARDFPALVVDGIYYLAPRNNVYALDAATGEELWSYESYMLSTAPVIAGGVLYGASQAAEYVFALDAATSEEIWTQPIEDFNAYSLTVVDGILYGQLDEGPLVRGRYAGRASGLGI